MLKCAPGVWRKREIYLIIEKSLIVFEKNNIMLKMWRLAPGCPNYLVCYQKRVNAERLQSHRLPNAKALSSVCAQINLFGVLLNQTEIRLYLPFSD